MFIPNLTGKLHRKSARNVFGKVTFSPPVEIQLAIVTLGEAIEDSEVRADQSATRGGAEITVLNARLLLPASVIVAENDVIEVSGELVEIAAVKRRTNVVGELDHWEVDGNLKAEM